MRARDLMTTPAITCHVNDPLAVAAARMWDADIGVLAVVNDDGKLTGMVTDRDICMAAYTQARALDEILVHTAMATEVARASADSSIDEIERLMAKRQIRRIPIIDADEKPIGMVSTNDLSIANAPKLAPTLAAICQHRDPNKRAA
jgi:CBS domain-containing protein